MAMDAKDLRIESALGAHRDDGNTKYAQSGTAFQSNGNKPYHDIGSNSLVKVDVPTSRPCAIIGPDRVVPPPTTNDVYVKKVPVEPWPCTDSIYQHPPEYPHKPTEYQLSRNISPRQTFQENMQRIMVPPSYASVKNSEDHCLKNPKLMPLESKFCDVPYTISPINNEPKTVKSSDGLVLNNNSNQPVLSHGWASSGVNVRPLRPYGAPDLYQYSEYSSCPGPRPISMIRPHRNVHEDIPQVYQDRYHEANVRFKPYPTTKERTLQNPHSRYDYIHNYPTAFQPHAPYPPHKYELPKSIPTHPYSVYPPVSLKYLERRLPVHTMEKYSRSPTQVNFNQPLCNQNIPPTYGTLPGQCLPNRAYPYAPDSSSKNMIQNRLYFDSNNARKYYTSSENMFINDINRTASIKADLMYPSYPPLNLHSLPPHHMYRKENSLKGYEHSIQYRNIDYSANVNPLGRLPLQFSPQTMSISPSDSNTSNDTTQLLGIAQDDCGYASQSSTASIRSTDSGGNRIPNDIYRRHDVTLSQMNKFGQKLTTNPSSKDKKGLNVRQFLQMWNEGDDEGNDNKESTKQRDPNNSLGRYESANSQEQLYVLGLVNVPKEELGKYDHIQKISKLPENIKGYNSIELLNQYEKLVESPGLNHFALKPPQAKQKDLNVPIRNNFPRHDLEVSNASARPLSPLDVEAKISQSVIHKDVGCNFEIRPCSPQMLNVELATPVHSVLGERLIEKVVNPVITKSPARQRLEEINNNSSSSSPKASSCKMANNQYPSPHINDSLKTNYCLQDLESNSGVCLASLPRLDNDIELNFPEINQQFINDNKISSIRDLPLLDAENGGSAYKSKNKGRNFITEQFNSGSDSDKDISKLSKYRKQKRNSIPNNSDDILNMSLHRTDSVIIKNPENAKAQEEYNSVPLINNVTPTIENIENPINMFVESDRVLNYADKINSGAINKKFNDYKSMDSDTAIDFSLNKSDDVHNNSINHLTNLNDALQNNIESNKNIFMHENEPINNTNTEKCCIRKDPKLLEETATCNNFSLSQPQSPILGSITYPGILNNNINLQSIHDDDKVLQSHETVIFHSKSKETVSDLSLVNDQPVTEDLVSRNDLPSLKHDNENLATNIIALSNGIENQALNFCLTEQTHDISILCEFKNNLVIENKKAHDVIKEIYVEARFSSQEKETNILNHQGDAGSNSKTHSNIDTETDNVDNLGIEQCDHAKIQIEPIASEVHEVTSNLMLHNENEICVDNLGIEQREEAKIQTTPIESRVHEDTTNLMLHGNEICVDNFGLEQHEDAKIQTTPIQSRVHEDTTNQMLHNENEICVDNLGIEQREEAKIQTTPIESRVHEDTTNLMIHNGNEICVDNLGLEQHEDAKIQTTPIESRVHKDTTNQMLHNENEICVDNLELEQHEDAKIQTTPIESRIHEDTTNLMLQNENEIHVDNLVTEQLEDAEIRIVPIECKVHEDTTNLTLQNENEIHVDNLGTEKLEDAKIQVVPIESEIHDDTTNLMLQNKYEICVNNLGNAQLEDTKIQTVPIEFEVHDDPTNLMLQNENEVSVDKLETDQLEDTKIQTVSIESEVHDDATILLLKNEVEMSNLKSPSGQQNAVSVDDVDFTDICNEEKRVQLTNNNNPECTKPANSLDPAPIPINDFVSKNISGTEMDNFQNDDLICKINCQNVSNDIKNNIETSPPLLYEHLNSEIIKDNVESYEIIYEFAFNKELFSSRIQNLLIYNEGLCTSITRYGNENTEKDSSCYYSNSHCVPSVGDNSNVSVKSQFEDKTVDVNLENNTKSHIVNAQNDDIIFKVTSDNSIDSVEIETIIAGVDHDINNVIIDVDSVQQKDVVTSDVIEKNAIEAVGVGNDFSESLLEVASKELDDTISDISQYRNTEINDNLHNQVKETDTVHLIWNELPSRRNRTLKRSLSESAVVDIKGNYDNNLMYGKKRAKVADSEVLVESQVLTENLTNFIQSNRRNSVSTIYNDENVSFCILIENDCVLTEENESCEKICYTEIPDECLTTICTEGCALTSELTEDISYEDTAQICSEENAANSELTADIYYEDSALMCTNEDNINSENIPYEEPECPWENNLVLQNMENRTIEDTWVEDVACMETVFSDDIAEDIIITAPSTPKDSESSEDESGNMSFVYNINGNEHTNKVKHIYGNKMCGDDAELVEKLYRTPQMNVNKTLIDRESQLSLEYNRYYDNESLEKILSESNTLDRHSSVQNDTVPDKSLMSPNTVIIDDVHENKENSQNLLPKQENKNDIYCTVALPDLVETELLEKSNSKEYDTCLVHSCESSCDNTVSYKKAEQIQYAISSSPEVSSTTSEEKGPAILLKIRSYKGSKISEVNEMSATCNYTPTQRPLITKAAQKYIPPLKETLHDLKVKIRLPKQSLYKLQQLKKSKEKPKIDTNTNKLYIKSFPRETPKKPKPKFEDVLMSIDEMQFRKHKTKNKKNKQSVPKVIIKKNENGAHYASTQTKETFNPDLTGRKWQPWVFLEKSNFVDKMALKQKFKAIYSHRKKTFVLAEHFRKYKSISNAKFIISHPKSNDNISTGKLKYTFRLKHS